MGQAKRRKDLGLLPEKTSKKRQKVRIKRDADIMGLGFPEAMSLIASLGMGRKRRTLLPKEITDSFK
jgi:hypothetical protein